MIGVIFLLLRRDLTSVTDKCDSSWALSGLSLYPYYNFATLQVDFIAVAISAMRG